MFYDYYVIEIVIENARITVDKTQNSFRAYVMFEYNKKYGIDPRFVG
jgi:hypothetical protein